MICTPVILLYETTPTLIANDSLVIDIFKGVKDKISIQFMQCLYVVISSHIGLGLKKKNDTNNEKIKTMWKISSKNIICSQEILVAVYYMMGAVQLYWFSLNCVNKEICIVFLLLSVVMVDFLFI